MRTFPNGARTVLARTISAEVRSRIGADRALTGQKLAASIGRSQNYMAERLRDEKSFTVDDVEALAEYFGEHPAEFIAGASDRWGEQVHEDLSSIRLMIDARAKALAHREEWESDYAEAMEYARGLVLEVAATLKPVDPDGFMQALLRAQVPAPGRVVPLRTGHPYADRVGQPHLDESDATRSVRLPKVAKQSAEKAGAPEDEG